MKLFGLPLSLLLASSAAERVTGEETRRLDAADFVDSSMSMLVVGIGKRDHHGHSRPDKSCRAPSYSAKGGKGSSAKGPSAKSDKGGNGAHTKARKLQGHPIYPYTLPDESKMSGHHEDIDECAVPRGEMCDGHPYYKLHMDSEGYRAHARRSSRGLGYGNGSSGLPWTYYAEIPGHYGGGPGYGPGYGSFSHCVLAPIHSREEFDLLVLETERQLKAWDSGNGGGVSGYSASADEDGDVGPQSGDGGYGNVPDDVYIGVVKSSLDVARDNGGKGSRKGWHNLDGTMADVCDEDMWHGDPEQPDNGYGGDGRPEIRLALVDGHLVDYPDDKELYWAMYKCCLKTVAFPSCDGDKY